MLAHATHVFLGPTLDTATARSYLWDAHYHPPIQCGDIIRLLRLAPQRIILIDGLYEQVPAVWHKEIMLALDRGIEVYGAASIGALRAAELYRYGMIGVGKVFQAFKSHQLTDDDEVAVLHQGVDQNSLPLNDAMVSIRETLEHAYQNKIIGIALQQALIQWCKSQFYPSRSLLQALGHMKSEFKDECDNLHEWLNQHGLIDVKREDAILVLQQVQATLTSETLPKKNFEMPYTKFIASLVDDVVGTPFSYSQPWFPEAEKKLNVLSLQKPDDYNLLIELAGLIKNAYSVINHDQLLDDPNQYLHYIEKNDLYVPEKLHQFLRQHQTLSSVSLWLLHYTCLGTITNERIKNYLPAVAFYFNYEMEQCSPVCLEFLSWILLFVLAHHEALNDARLTIKQQIFDDHLQEIQFWKRYKQQPELNVKVLLDFVLMYMKIIYIHHGVKDFKLGPAETPAYFDWIYDAMALYGQ